MRAAEIDLARKCLELLKDDPKAAELREKYQKTQVLSKRELKILSTLAENRKAA